MRSATFADRYPLAFIVALMDIGIVFVSAALSYFLRFSEFYWAIPYQIVVLVVSLLLVSICSFSGVYKSWRGLNLYRQLAKVAAGWVLTFICLLVLLVILKQNHQFSRIWLGSWFLLGTTLDCLYKALFFTLLKVLRRKGHNVKSACIIGNGQSVNLILKNSTEHPDYGFKVSQIITIPEAGHNDTNWKQSLADVAAHEIWICLPLNEGDLLKRILYELRNSTAEIRYFPGFEDMRLLNHKVTNILGLYSLDLSCSPLDGVNQWIKRSEDLILGLLLSMIIFPVCLVIALAVKLSSPGPVLFKQYRNGVSGRKFKVYKFRTMRRHEETAGKVTQARKGDDRITRLGAFLRRTSLDELPQFYNVLQGRMSIVGPRPHALEHNEYYKDLVESYMWRHKVKPGITGWAQVNGFRGETDTLEKMEKRVEYDLWYIENWSLGLDIKIILWTIFKGFCNKNAY